MALTGAQVSGADAVYLGLATHFTTSERLAKLGDELADHGTAALALAALRSPTGELPAVAGAVKDCFGVTSVAGILAKLEGLGTE